MYTFFSQNCSWTLIASVKDTMEKAATGMIEKEGGILPDDNVRIYVPMDLNADIIMWQLYSLFGSLGYPSESNESV